MSTTVGQQLSRLSARHPLRAASRSLAHLPSSRHYASSSTFIPPLSHPSASHSSIQGYGQPLPFTHPHLLAPGELTQGISATEYEARRKALMDGLEDGAVVVIASGRIKYMSGQIFYKFRQASSFWYLTGWEEPDSVLVLEKTSAARGYRMTMFCRTNDATDQMWHGPRSGPPGAMETFGADEAFDISLLTVRLKSILTTSSSSLSPIYVDLPGGPSASRISSHTEPRRTIFDYLVPSASDFADVASLLSGEKGRRVLSAEVEVDKLRVVKSQAEIRVMRRAADISSGAHAKVMTLAQPTATHGITESSLVAHFEYLCAQSGSPRPAYVPVCASGASALTIHYTTNLLPLHAGDLVLFDAGCEWGGYASDITRTFPVSGTFSTPQRELYEAVLRVEKACIRLCTVEGGRSLDELHRVSVELMRVELRDLGFNLRGGEMERSLYPHFVGHPLGIDLHDTPSFGRDQPLHENMVITIEPGLSVPPHANFPKGFHNLSVRIEDEVLVQQQDCVVLSIDAPKELVDVEACCQGLLEGVQ